MVFQSASTRDGIKLLIVPVFDDPASWSELPENISNVLKHMVDGGNFEPSLKKTLELFDVCDVKRLVFVGLGKQSKLEGDRLRTFGVQIVKIAHKYKLDSVGLHLSGVLSYDRNFGKIIEGVVTGGSVDVMKSEDTMKKIFDNILKQVFVFGKDQFDDVVKESQLIAEGTLLARRLTWQDSNIVNVDYMESQAFALRSSCDHVHVRSYDRHDLTTMGANLFLAVNRGSAQEPKMVEIEYAPPGTSDDAPIVFVGKGLVFDTGGVNVKPDSSMGDMQMDMSGAAVVLAAMKTLAKLGVKKRVVGLLGLTDNVISATSYVQAEVIKSMKGVTVEIGHTDAEGRLVLADTIAHGCTLKPKVLVDVATLTGAVVVALGDTVSGLFSNSPEVADLFAAAAVDVDEGVWRMPILPAHRKCITSKVADISNIGDKGRGGGSCTAAAFLEKFVDNGVKWAHIDIAGVAKQNPTQLTTPQGFTGYGVRLLVDFVRKMK